MISSYRIPKAATILVVGQYQYCTISPSCISRKAHYLLQFVALYEHARKFTSSNIPVLKPGPSYSTQGNYEGHQAQVDFFRRRVRVRTDAVNCSLSANGILFMPTLLAPVVEQCAESRYAVVERYNRHCWAMAAVCWSITTRGKGNTKEARMYMELFERIPAVCINIILLLHKHWRQRLAIALYNPHPLMATSSSVKHLPRTDIRLWHHDYNG